MAQDNKAFEVDWRAHREEVVAHLPYGGTVYVVGTVDAPYHLFDRRLADNWLGMCTERSWRYVRLWANDGRSHHRGEVLELAARALSIELPQSQTIENVSVLTNNHAAIMKIVGNTINVYADSTRDLEITQMRHLIKTVRQSGDLGLAIILPDAHLWSESQREIFYQALWVDNLVALGDRVMVFVLHVSGQFGHEAGTFPPPPTLTLTLENYVDREGQSGCHAIEDIANHALERRWMENQDGALGFATGLVHACDDMDSLYRKLGSIKFQSKVDQTDA